MNDQELTAEARRVAAELRRRPGDRELIRYAAGLLAAAAGRLAIHGPTVSGSPFRCPAAAQPGRCGDHHASGVTNCTREAGHDGAHHNGSGLTWGSSDAPPCDGDLPGEEE